MGCNCVVRDFNSIVIMSHRSLCEIYCFSPCPFFQQHLCVLYHSKGGLVQIKDTVRSNLTKLWKKNFLHKSYLKYVKNNLWRVGSGTNTGNPQFTPPKRGESLPGCPIAGVLAALMKNYNNGFQKFHISLILKVEPHGFLHSLQHLSAHRSARPDFQILIWNIF